MSTFNVVTVVLICLMLDAAVNGVAVLKKDKKKQECKEIIKDIGLNITKKKDSQKYSALMDMFYVLLKERKSCKCLEDYVNQLEKKHNLYSEAKACRKEQMEADLQTDTLFGEVTRGAKYEAVIDMLTMLLQEREKCKCLKEVVQRLKEDEVGVNKRKNCRELLKSGKTADGIYTISPDKKTSFKVYCDMKSGGWTIIQRRHNGAVSFDRTWREYAAGFGDLKKDHWLGLTKIHILTKSTPGPDELLFDMIVNGKVANATYSGFSVDGEDSKFKLHVNGNVKYSNVSTDCINNNAFYYQNGMLFTTKDSDNDLFKTNCAKSYQNAGWWYKDCYRANLNRGFSSMTFSSCKVAKSEIKIR